MGMPDLFRKISAVAETSTLLTALTSAITLTPDSSLFFAPLTLPSVLHKSEDVDGKSDHPTSSMHLMKKGLLMALGSTLGSLFKTWGILPSIVENVGSQAIISTCSAAYIALTIWIHRKVVKIIGAEDDWTSSWLFGLIWAGMWLVWTKLSPLGRHGVPTAEELDVHQHILRYIGPLGLDFLVGLIGHAISNTCERSNLITASETHRLTHLQPPAPHYGATDQSSSTTPTAAETSSEPSRSSRSDGLLVPPTPPRRSTRRAPSTVSSYIDDVASPSWKGPRKLLVGITGLICLSHVFPPPISRTLDAPVSEITPLSVGCAIPQESHPSLNETIWTLRQFGNRAQLLLLPETALALRYAGERTFAIDQIQKDVCEQYGAYVMISMEAPAGMGKARNEVVLVGPHGVVGSYAKKSLVPMVEGHRYLKGKENPPVWTLNMAHPHGVTKPEWSSVPPFVRPVDFTPLICLDTLHPSLVPYLPAPTFLAIPAAAQPALAEQVITHAELLSSTHGIPSIVCSRGASAAIDETGQIKHRQKGGKGFLVTLAIPWHGDGEMREHTWAETLGPLGVLAGLTGALMVTKAGEVWKDDGTQGLITAGEEGGKKVRGMIGWRAPDRESTRRRRGDVEWQGLLDEDANSGRASLLSAIWPTRGWDLLS